MSRFSRASGPFLVVAGILVATPASALDVCRRAKTVTNSFDGKSAVQVPVWGGTVSLNEDGANLTVRITGGGVQAVALPQGWSFTYALEDGTKVSFFSKEEVVPTGTAYATQYTAGVYTTWTITAPVSAEAAHAIANSGPVALRYTIGTDERTAEYGQLPRRTMAMSFACVANKLAQAK